MIRINMGDYATDEGFGLFGNPHTYDLGGKRGALTQAFLGRPFAVLLLDELEKAHPVLMDRLLPLMDEGVFINGAGETISCRSMIIIATTNAGAEVYRGAGIGFAGDQDLDEKRRRVEHRVREVFRFEFLNRFDAVVHFNPLSRQACRTIAQWELERLRHRVGLRRYGLQLSIDETVLDWLAVHGYHPDFGARFMKRTIERSVTRTVAESIVRRQPPPGAKLELLVRGQAIHCRVEPPRSKPRSAPIVPKNPPEGSRPVMSAAELTKRAAPLLQELSRREEERASLLERMGAEPFGQDPEREVVLQRFRELEVWVHMARRHAEPIEAWRLDSDREHGLLEATEACLRWEERSRHAGPGRIWVDISAADVHPSNPAFLHDLVDIYLRYAQRRDFEAHVEAIELRAKGPSRLVLEVQGPGCLHWFSAEAGLHRKRVASGPDALARVQVLPRNATSSRRPTRARSGKEDGVQLDLAFEVQIEVPRVGRVSRLAGANAPTLGCLADDLEAVLATQPLDSSPARLYGGTVSDPRTGVSVPSAQVEEG
ncbi:MAG: AAA family ATPase, partial [Myxococcota bacterium]